MNSFRFVMLLIAGLLATGIAGAGTMVYTGGTVGTEGPLVNAGLEEQDAQSIKLYFELTGFELSPVSIGGVEYQEIRVQHEGATLDAGMPDLPSIVRSIIIPNDAAMAVRVLSSTWTDYENIRIAPSKGNILRTVDPATVPYEFSDTYSEDRWYPEEIVTKSDPYILRDYRGMVVRVHPVQYNPVQNKIRVHNNVRVECMRSGAGTINVFSHASTPERINADFAQLYADHFLNEEQSRYTPVIEQGEMLIIAYDSFMAAMQPLVDWKNQMGMATTLVSKSEAGANSTAIKAYIQNVYNNSDLGYVLLVGDAAQIPTFSSGGGGADPMYSLLAGSDSYPDIFVGRFSAENNTHVETQVTRTLVYERDIIAGEDWPQRATGIASTEGPGHFGEYDNVLWLSLLESGGGSVQRRSWRCQLLWSRLHECLVHQWIFKQSCQSVDQHQ
jgi:peptidase C25-like protein